jgi:hypothetical protein
MTKLSSYNGKPMIILEPETKWPFQFGVAKAHMILANLDAIKAFASANPKVIKLTGNTVEIPLAIGGAE